MGCAITYVLGHLIRFRSPKDRSRFIGLFHTQGFISLGFTLLLPTLLRSKYTSTFTSFYLVRSVSIAAFLLKTSSKRNTVCVAVRLTQVPLHLVALCGLSSDRNEHSSFLSFIHDSTLYTFKGRQTTLVRNVQGSPHSS